MCGDRSAQVCADWHANGSPPRAVNAHANDACGGIRGVDRGAWHSRCPLAHRRAVMRRRVIAFRTHGIARHRMRRRNDMNLINRLRTFVRDDEGQDLLEYALLVALIALVAVAAVTAAGVKVDAVFNDIVAKIPS